MAEVFAVRRLLPVPGAWAYGRKGDVVIAVFDIRCTDQEIAERMDLVRLRASLDDSDSDCDGGPSQH